jgi:putative glycosyltransferase (TIGR04348 family)
MKIGIITPAPPKSKYGNRVTALRWARILKKLGHSVTVEQAYRGRQLDLLIALHARRSYDSIRRFHTEHPSAPIIVALTGTDLYRDLANNVSAQKSLDIATRIVGLQPKAVEELHPRWRKKTDFIYQSVAATTEKALVSSSARRTFDICVVGHLRPVKDPFRAAMASRLLPESSRIRIIHVGGAMSKASKERADAEMKINPRYRWLGEVSPARVRRVMGRSCAMVISSKMEGGANVLGEAIVAGIPVLASRISGSTGILGENYPGYFQTRDTGGLARLMLRCESDSSFLADLAEHCRRLAKLFDPAREERAWADLVKKVTK